MGDAPGATVTTGKARSTDSYTFDFCSDPTLMLTVDVGWAKPNRDFALRVTDPNDKVFYMDRNGVGESFLQRAPIPEGTWNIEVISKSKGPSDYFLTIAFNVDPAYQ